MLFIVKLLLCRRKTRWLYRGEEPTIKILMIRNNYMLLCYNNSMTQTIIVMPVIS